MPDWNWHPYPVSYALVQIANLAIGWCLSGLVLAWFVQGVAARN